MGRPKKENLNDQATVKIEEAFWRLLESRSYSEITVRLISEESETNRNSFYYHYQDMDDLARKAFKSNASEDVSEALFSALRKSVQGRDSALADLIDPVIIPHARRVMLCAGSDSVFLNHMVHDLLKEVWFEKLSITEEDLTDEEKMQARFVFSGLVSVLGSPQVRECPGLMSALAGTILGKAALKALQEIAENQRKAKG